MKRITTKGITLMELVAILVVAGIAIPVLMTMWATVSWQSVRSEAIGDSAFFAQGLLEEIKSKRFDEKTAQPWTSSLGADAGENTADANTFDDVDDFVGTTDARITTPAAGYSRSVSIGYVNLSAQNSWTDCGAVTCTAVETCTPCSECCFKRITVNVNRQAGQAGNVSMETIVAGL